MYTQGADEPRDFQPMPDAFIGLWEYNVSIEDKAQISIKTDRTITRTFNGKPSTSSEYHLIYWDEEQREAYVLIKYHYVDYPEKSYYEFSRLEIDPTDSITKPIRFTKYSIISSLGYNNEALWDMPTHHVIALHKLDSPVRNNVKIRIKQGETVYKWVM